MRTRKVISGLGLFLVIVAILMLACTAKCQEIGKWRWDRDPYVKEQTMLGISIGVGIATTIFVDKIVNVGAEQYPKLFFVAKPRDLFEGMDRETHAVGGFGGYYWFRHMDNNKAGSFMKICIASLLWEAMNSCRIMDYRQEWYRKTSLGHLLIHFAGDGWDIQDHKCVLLGAGTAIGFEYIYETYNHFFPNRKKWLSIYSRNCSLGLEIKF